MIGDKVIYFFIVILSEIPQSCILTHCCLLCFWATYELLRKLFSINRWSNSFNQLKHRNKSVTMKGILLKYWLKPSLIGVPVAWRILYMFLSISNLKMTSHNFKLKIQRWAITYMHGRPQKFFQGEQHRHFAYPFSGCERCSVNGPSQNASPLLHHKENSPSFYSFC